ncbi:MAG: hypothetical protein ABIP63_10870 [Thermoanaerobaculia bacterium]
MNSSHYAGPIEDDPRFAVAIAHFQAGDFDDAGDGFEELFFEAVRDELEFVRLFLQVSVGVFHAQCGQKRPAVERLEEGLRAMAGITSDRGFDLQSLGQQVVQLIDQIKAGQPQLRPRLMRRDGSSG